MAAPKLPDNKSNTKPNPIDPIPTVIPAIKALPGLTPKIKAITKMIIGRNVFDPKPINHCNKLITTSIFSFPFYYS